MSKNAAIPLPKARAGRKQTTVAKAWITRSGRGAVFKSRVSLGKGRVFELSTGTRRRELALDFCRLHLAHHLSRGDAPFTFIPPSATVIVSQPELFSKH